jgi:uncharacterized protein YegL
MRKDRKATNNQSLSASLWLSFVSASLVASSSPIFGAGATSAKGKPAVTLLRGAVEEGVYAKLLEAGIYAVKEGNALLPAKVKQVKFHSQAYLEGVSEGDKILTVTIHDSSLDVLLDRSGTHYSLNLATHPEFANGWQNVSKDGNATAKAGAGLDKPDGRATLPMLAKVESQPSTAGWRQPKGGENIEEDLSSQKPQNDAPKKEPDPTRDPESNNLFGREVSESEQKKILAQHDVVILIDKSGSMNTPDCDEKGTVSRWQWCRAQTVGLAKDLNNILPEGLTVDVFSNDFDVYPHADAAKISDVFKNFSPGGSTNTGAALWDRLRAYLEDKPENGKTKRPILIAVITDGDPTDGRTTQDAIISATRQIKNANEISITFLQVGREASGTAVLDELANNLVDEGAKFDIVDHLTYDQLVRTGLRQALVSAIISPRLKAQPENSEGTAHSDSFFEHMRASLDRKWLKHQTNHQAGTSK